MPDTILIAALAFVLLAATAHRHRRDAGVVAPGQVRALRVVAGALLLAAFVRAAGPLAGERIVRFLVGGSIAGIAVVLALSFDAARVLAPVRWLLSRPRPAAAPAPVPARARATARAQRG
jgi:hypothetical protein